MMLMLLQLLTERKRPRRHKRDKFAGISEDSSLSSAFQALVFVLHSVQSKSSTFTGAPMAVAGVKPRNHDVQRL